MKDRSLGKRCRTYAIDQLSNDAVPFAFLVLLAERGIFDDLDFECEIEPVGKIEENIDTESRILVRPVATSII